MLVVTRETPHQDDVRALLARSDAYAAALYPAESNHLIDEAALSARGVAFFVARIDGRALGCGAMVPDPDGGAAEIKRMFVETEARGRGVGRALLRAIEGAARSAGIGIVRLETGIAQPEALGLYEADGYVRRGPFGKYRRDPLSVFMEKHLGAACSPEE